MDKTYDAIELNALGYDGGVPFFIIDGRADRLAPPNLAAAYLQKVRAPQRDCTSSTAAISLCCPTRMSFSVSSSSESGRMRRSDTIRFKWIPGEVG